MPRTPANPDPTTSVQPLVRSSVPVPTSDIPNPTSEIASPLPALSPRDQSLLAAYAKAQFDLAAFAAAASLSAKQLADFAASPAIQAHIDAMMDLARKSLYLRAVQARHKAIAKFEAITDTAEDQIEQRRASTQLLRATSSPIIGSGAPQTNHQSGDESQNQEDAEPSPLPRERPHIKFTAEQVAATLSAALIGSDETDDESAAATLIAFSDGPLTVNDKILSAADPKEPVEGGIAVIQSSELRKYFRAESYVIQPAPETPEDATQTTIVAHITSRTTWLYAPKPVSTRPLTLRLTRRPDAHQPNCWLLASITTGLILENSS